MKKAIASFACVLLFVLATTPRADTLRFGIWRPVDPIDPIYITTIPHSALAAAVFETLVLVGQDHEIRPGQAESWSVSDDGLTYTFRLRKGITWSDGSPVVAEDFVAGFQRLVDPANALEQKPVYLVNQIRNARDIIHGAVPPTELGVRAVDARTLEIQLANPASYFLSILAYPALSPAPRHEIAVHGEDWWKQRPMVSNGQLQLVSTDGDHYVLQRRDDHWEPSQFKTVHITPYDTNTAVFKDLIRGDLDIALGIPNKQVEYTERGYPGRVDRLVAPGTYYGVFNTRDPALADANVRRALAMLVDNTKIAESLGLKKESIGTTFTTPELLQPSAANLADWIGWPMGRRVKEAQRLLAEAGYSNEAPLEITILAGTHNDFDKIAFGIRSMWGRASVKVKLVPVPPTELSMALRAKTYQFAVAAWYGDYDDPLTFLSIFQENGDKNNSAWSHPEYTRLLDMALREDDADERRPLYDEMEKMLGEQAPVFAIIYPELLVGVSNRIEKYSVNHAFIRVRTIELKKQ